MTKDKMKKALAVGPCEVTFTKANGEDRKMVCTTNLNFMTEDKRPKGTSEMKGRESVIAAFDVAKGEWRSFRVDSVKSFTAGNYE